MEEGRRVSQKDIAKMLDVSTRTLRNWKELALKEDVPKVGRPKLCNKKQQEYRYEVKREWLRQGRPGWRPVKASLKNLPTRLIQAEIKELKRNERKVLWEYKKENSIGLDVKYKNVIWAQDTTMLNDNREYVEVIKDRCTQKLVCAETISSPTSLNVIKTFKKGQMRDDLPIVLMTDNGSGYKSKIMTEYLRENKVIHLKSLPRTPQHNGAIERSIREFKRVKIDGDLSINETLSILNKNRRYASKNYLTSYELERCSTIEISVEQRERIYACYNKIILKLNETVPNFRKRKLLERKLVFELLENEGLVETRIGSRNY